MGVVLTRPVQEAERWAARLRQRGVEPLVLPLLAIGAAPDPEALRQAAAGADSYRAVMFVSANAVHGFFAVNPRFMKASAWAPGPATVEALREAGVPEARISAPPEEAAQFDSEHLWPVVQDQLRAGDGVLVVRGADRAGRSQGRDWLLQQLAGRGVAVETVAAYTRAAPSWSEAQCASARRAAGDGSLWLFSSSEAVANLAVLLA